mmetsp:Transcript_23305/g.59404  ORF Transcript_23305/g.59404 Transcript_23305/m.59404 type:complete len:200 (+) Transcript_23305:517-1116(+)
MSTYAVAIASSLMSHERAMSPKSMMPSTSLPAASTRTFWSLMSPWMTALRRLGASGWTRVSNSSSTPESRGWRSAGECSSSGRTEGACARSQMKSSRCAAGWSKLASAALTRAAAVPNFRSSAGASGTLASRPPDRNGSSRTACSRSVPLASVERAWAIAFPSTEGRARGHQTPAPTRTASIARFWHSMNAGSRDSTPL